MGVTPRLYVMLVMGKTSKQAYAIDLDRSSFFCCVGHGDAALDTARSKSRKNQNAMLIQSKTSLFSCQTPCRNIPAHMKHIFLSLHSCCWPPRVLAEDSLL